MFIATFFLNHSTGPCTDVAKFFLSKSSHRFVYALEFFAAHEPEVLFFLSSGLTKMVHASRTTRHLDSLARRRVLRWAIRSWPGRASNADGGGFCLHAGQFCQRAAQYSGRGGGPRRGYPKRACLLVDAEHIIETNKETPPDRCRTTYRC